MKFTRTTALCGLAAVIVAGGITTAYIVGSHSANASDNQSTAGPSARPTIGPTSAPGNPSATPSPDPTPPPSATPGPSAKPSASSGPALTPGQVEYAHQSWGDPATEVGVIILAPKTWKMVKLATFEVRFTSPNKLWTMRVNANSSDLPVKTLVDRQLTHTRSSSRDFELVSRVDGSTKATNPTFAGVVFHHTTFTYSYTDPARGTRLVVDRFVSLDDIPHTLFEISTAGRPQDATALAAITAKATEDFIRLP